MGTLQRTCVTSVALKVAANLAVQLLSQKDQISIEAIDGWRLLYFAAFGFVSAPLNSVWQRRLETTFPTRISIPPRKNPKNGRTSEKVEEISSIGPVSNINWVNVAVKLALDQLIGLFVLNTIFLTCMNLGNWQAPNLILDDIRLRLVPVTKAGWRIWPIVAFTNFIFIPTDLRVLVISIVGFGWTMYLSLL